MTLRHSFSLAAILLCAGIALFSPPSYACTSATTASYDRVAYTAPTYATAFKIEKILPKPLIVTWEPATSRALMGTAHVLLTSKNRPAVPLMVACRGARRPSLS